MRDPWTNIYYNKSLPRTTKTKQKDLKLETEVLKTADCVNVVSEGLKEEFADRAKKIEVLYNGFDEEDFSEIDNSSTDKFTVSYIGNLKPNQNIASLWEVLGELCTENAEFRKYLELNFTGNYDQGVLDAIAENNLNKNLQINPFVAHKEAVNLMQRTCLLLFIIPEAEGNNLILTGKLFEYLASGSEMLSIGPVDGNASHIIKGCKASAMMDYADRATMKMRILDAFTKWKNNKQVASKRPFNVEIDKYSRKGQTKKLADILNQISSNER